MKISGNVIPNSGIYTDELGDFRYFIEMQMGDIGYALNEEHLQTKISNTQVMCGFCEEPHVSNDFTKFYLEPTFEDIDDDANLDEYGDYLEQEPDEG